MKKNIFFFLLVAVSFVSANAQNITTLFEKSNGTKSPAYADIISWWKQLDKQSSNVTMLTMGPSDAGFPLHLVMISSDGVTNPTQLKKNNKRIILINNGIHPGEPDGIDASMLLARDIVTGKIKLPKNVALGIIPVYNIGGCLNRSAFYRVDQDGPEEFGFRGNSQNLDLNRDFIKCDSKEAKSFASIFHLLDPDVFIDNHVSDGADYQHVMTLLSTQNSKLGGVMGAYLAKTFEPALYGAMKEKGYDLVPYVNSFGDTPENGWPEYWDSPRYGSGYGALWSCFSFVPETHMLKPYVQRVNATYALMKSFIEFTSANSSTIKKLRDETKATIQTTDQFPIGWHLDKSSFKEVTYKGFEAGYKPSEVSGQPRLFYNRSKPFEKTVKIYNYFAADKFINKPLAYIIPQGWWKVIDLLQLNKVEMKQLAKDTSILVEVYHIEDYKTQPKQYEMHHMNTDVKISTTKEKINFRKGDWYIPMNQIANRFIIETLEPQAEDSYFTWNYFDAILGQKEGYSAYDFEDSAAVYLKSNQALQAKLNEKRSTDTSFAKNGRAQLNFIYQNSPWYEPDHNRYPVYRIVK